MSIATTSKSQPDFFQPVTGRVNERTILAAMAATSQARVAERTGLPECTISRIKNGRVSEMSKVLEACHLKVTDEDDVMISPDELNSYVHLSGLWIAHVESIH